jgi:hypothetical protein
MNAALHFELVDSVATVDSPAHLGVVADRIVATPMHPLERRVLDRALRARAEVLVMHQQLLSPDTFTSMLAESEPRVAVG